jgi:hypothetical protein
MKRYVLGFCFGPSFKTVVLIKKKTRPAWQVGRLNGLGGHTWCMNILRPHFIPGVTVLGLLDYYIFKDHPTRPELRAPVSYMEKNHRAFEKMIEWPERCSCAFFRYLG